jgi:purine-binding chemotaxis protein CheW
VPEVGSAELQRMTTAIITKEKSMISHLDLDLLLDEEIELAA